MEGIILKGIGGFYYVQAGNKIFETKACGRFRKEKIIPYVGDKVELSENLDKIISIHPRKNVFIRPPVSNIDQMVIVVTLKSPVVDLITVDSMLISVEDKKIDGIICINKSDLVTSSECEKVSGIYKKAGYKVIVTSAIQLSGTDDFDDLLCGKVTAFAGNSGVGKSSLVNIIEGKYTMETGNVSEKLERGRHTTRHVELLPLKSGGYVVDTPGFSRIDLPKMPSSALGELFPEIRERANLCKFKGCSHISEPECEVIRLTQSGEISRERYESYKYIYDKLKGFKEWEND